MLTHRGAVQRVVGPGYRDLVRWPLELFGRMRTKRRSGDVLNAIRRNVSMSVDQIWVLILQQVRRLRDPRRDATMPFDGRPRFALLVVNFSTTRYLKLLLLTLAEQSARDLVRRIIVVDNGSRDGGAVVRPPAASKLPIVSVVERRHFLTHAHGMRAATRMLEQVEVDTAPELRSNVLLFCDPDVVFRSPNALQELADVFASQGAALAGELRRWREFPDIQASFFAVRRDVYDRPDVLPPVHHGSPAYWMQRSIWRAGELPVVDFRSNSGGYILHRGRAGVSAARRYRPRHSYATAPRSSAHFMGLPDGERTWNAIERRYGDLLEPSNEGALLDDLADRLAGLATTRCGDRPRSNQGAAATTHHRIELNGSTALVWSPTARRRRSAEDAIVLDCSGSLFTLRGTGRVVWLVFEHPTSLDDAIDTLAEAFEPS